jgi:hypothetical protein
LRRRWHRRNRQIERERAQKGSASAAEAPTMVGAETVEASVGSCGGERHGDSPAVDRS